MRALVWLIGLFALAVGLVVAARYNNGYVLLALPTHRIELSLNLALILLALSFVGFYALARAVAIALGMPARAREFRRGQEQARARRSLAEALRAYFSGRYARAERAAREALAGGEAAVLALTVAARSAHELRAFPARDEYLRQIDGQDVGDAYLGGLTRAELLLAERRYQEALHVLERLPEKHAAAFKLELKAHQLARNWDRVLALLPQIEKRKLVDPVVASQLKRYALIESLRRNATDAHSLREFWGRLAAEERIDHRMAAAAARQFMQTGDCEQAHRILEEALEADWDPGLLALYAECLPVDARKHLESAERWLEQHPGDPVLLLTLGRLCVHQGLWGKARSYLEASVAVEPSHSAYVELARLLERLGKAGEANSAYRRGLDLAVAQLKDSTGGRRRPAL
jgi:HemY protein